MRLVSVVYIHIYIYIYYVAHFVFIRKDWNIFRSFYWKFFWQKCSTCDRWANTSDLTYFSILQRKIIVNSKYSGGGVLIFSYLILIHQFDNFGGLRWAEAAWYEWVHWLPGPPIAARLYLTNSAKRKRRKPPQLMERWGASVILPPCFHVFYIFTLYTILLLVKESYGILIFTQDFVNLHVERRHGEIYSKNKDI